MADLPSATAKPCNDCPWRKNAMPGWLGPMNADEWITLAFSDEPIACHETITGDQGSWDDSHVRQCAGAADYRANISKLPRNSTVARGTPNAQVFQSPQEFKEYHRP